MDSDLIRGRLVSTKIVDGEFGETLKMLVIDPDTGFRYYGTMPRGLRRIHQNDPIEDTDEITVEAFIHETDDIDFWLFSRPRNGKVTRDILPATRKFEVIEATFTNLNTQEQVGGVSCTLCGSPAAWVRSTRNNRPYTAQVFFYEDEGYITPWIPHFTLCDEIQADTEHYQMVRDEAIEEIKERKDIGY